MNLRVDVLRAATQTITNHPAYIIEVGCMFSENEGLSTLILARHAAATGGKLVSIDADVAHLMAARELIREMSPEAISSIEFIEGYSTQVLSTATSSLPRLDLAFLDGGAQPEVCLQEFEIVASCLAEDGVIIVDDVQHLEPTAAFASPRPYGKGTLIYPALIIGDYLRYRAEKELKEPDAPKRPSFPHSPFIKRIRSTAEAELFSLFHHRLVTRNAHGMLVVGTPIVIGTLMQKLSSDS